MVIAAPLRRAQGQERPGLIRLRLFQSADVGGSTPRIEGLERRLAALKAWKDFRTPSTVGPWAKTTRWPSCERGGR
jgi:hypothetical protein